MSVFADISIFSLQRCIGIVGFADLWNICRGIAWCLAGGFLVWLCEIGITYLAALRSYTLFGISGCGVKFSFLLTFSAEIVFIKKIITIAPLLYCSTSNSYLTLVNSPTVVFVVVSTSGVACAAA